MVKLSPEELARAKKNNLTPEKYARLRAEAKTPYKGLRKFFYIAFAGSGFIGALIFFAKLATGENIATNLPNLALQIGVVVLMLWLFSLETKNKSE